MSDTKFLYERTNQEVHLSIKGLTNHELRALMVGLWLSLDLDDRVDHVKELQHYLGANSWPPPVSVHIADAIIEAK